MVVIHAYHQGGDKTKARDVVTESVVSPQSKSGHTPGDVLSSDGRTISERKTWTVLSLSSACVRYIVCGTPTAELPSTSEEEEEVSAVDVCLD